jgi:hypothetical protein|tara:strand:- start:1231 stop:1656 length:426 start_codon:yes stop_codon:yes gene_type:complete
MISDVNAAYIAGLFDGEGHIQYKQYMRQRRNNEKPYPTWSVRMEVSMTHKSVLLLIHNLLGVGTVTKRKNGKGSLGKKQQWRWRCQLRDAYYVCLLLQPYAHVKLEQINKIIKHYSELGTEKIKAKVINIANYKIKQQRMK